MSRLRRVVNPLLAALVLADTAYRARTGDALARDVLTIFLGLSLFVIVIGSLALLVGLPLPRRSK